MATNLLPGEFCHASVERRMVGSYRGLFATSDLPAGELLMVAKGLRHPAPRSTGGMASIDVPDLLDLIDALPADVRSWLLLACKEMHPIDPAQVTRYSMNRCTAHERNSHLLCSRDCSLCAVLRLGYSLWTIS